MEEKVAKMEEERREREQGETHISSRNKKSISTSSYCYYYTFQKPYEFLGSVTTALLRCLRGGGGGGGGGGAGSDPTSARDRTADNDPPASTISSTVSVRSYATVIRPRKPPTPPISQGKPPQIH